LFTPLLLSGQMGDLSELYRESDNCDQPCYLTSEYHWAIIFIDSFLLPFESSTNDTRDNLQKFVPAISDQILIQREKHYKLYLLLFIGG